MQFEIVTFKTSLNIDQMLVWILVLGFFVAVGYLLSAYISGNLGGLLSFQFTSQLKSLEREFFGYN